MEQGLVKPDVKRKPKPPKPPPKPAERNGNAPERGDKPTPAVPPRPTDAEMSTTQKRIKRITTADNKTNGNLIHGETKEEPSGSPVVPARPTEKQQLNATTKHSQRKRVQAEDTQGSRETHQSEVPKDEPDFKQDRGGLIAGMFRKTPKEKVPSPALTVSPVDSDPDNAEEKTSEHSREKGGFFSGILKKPHKPSDETPAPENVTSRSELSASDDSLSESNNNKDKRGGVFSGMFRKSPKTSENAQTEEEQPPPPPGDPAATKDNHPAATKDNLTENSKEKGGLFSGILRKSPKIPGERTPGQDKQSLQSELSASNDSLSENNTTKEKGGVFSGMFKKSPKPSEGLEEDKRSLHSELSASNDSLSDNKEKGGLFGGLLRKTPKAQVQEDLSASSDSLSENTNTKEKGGAFSGMFKKASRQAERDPHTQEDKQPLHGELSASSDSLSENSSKEKGGKFSGMFRRSPKPAGASQPEEDKESLHSELSASSESLSEKNKEKGGLFSGLLKKTPKASGEKADSQDKDAQKELSASNDSLSENNTSKEKSIFNNMFKKPQKAAEGATADEELDVNGGKELSDSCENLSDTTVPKEKKGGLAGIFKRSASTDNLSENEEKGGLFSGLLKKTPKASGDEAAALNKDGQKELSASNDSLSDNSSTKEKRVFSGMFKKAHKAAEATTTDEESNPDLDKKLSVSYDNLSDTATQKEKTGGLSGMFKRSPKPAPRSAATKDPLSDAKELSASCDSLTENLIAKHNLSAHSELSASNDSLTGVPKEKKAGLSGLFRRTPKAVEQQGGEDMQPPEGGSQLRRRRTIKKKRRVVSFRVKQTLPRIPKSSDKLPPIDEPMEMQELTPIQENTVEIQAVEMAAYPSEGNALQSEEENDELMEWWNAVAGWTEWNETSNFQEDEEEMAVEQAADRVFMAARLFVRLFNQRGASLQKRILELLAQADAADEFHKKTVSAAVGGGVASVAGSVATITGLILAPFTFGASIIVTAVGISVATAGSITAATANITDTVHSNMDRKKVEKMIQGYQEEIKEIRECLEFVQEGMETLQGWDFEKYSESAAKKALNHNIKHVMKEGGRAGKALMINTDKLISTVQVLGAAGGAAKAAQAISVTTGVMSALFLALDVFFLAKDSHELRKGAKTKFARKIREVCKDLQDGLLELNKVKTQLQKTMDGIELEEYEEIEEVEVEVDDDLESDPVKLAQLDLELDLLEEKLDQKVLEERVKSKEIKEKGNVESKKEGKEESKKGKGEETKVESKSGKLPEEEKHEMSEIVKVEKKTKEEVSKEPSEKGRKGEKEMENQTTTEKENNVSKREKAKEVTSKNERSEEEKQTDEKSKIKKDQERAERRSSDARREVWSGKEVSERVKKSDRENERRISERDKEKHGEAGRGSASRHGARSERERAKERSERGSKDESNRERHNSRDVERWSGKESEAERGKRVEMERSKEEKHGREMERGKKREGSEVKNETSREDSGREGRRERGEEKRGSKVESMRKQFESGGGERGMRRDDGGSQHRERERRRSDREHEPARRGSRSSSKSILEDGLYI